MCSQVFVLALLALLIPFTTSAPLPIDRKVIDITDICAAVHDHDKAGDFGRGSPGPVIECPGPFSNITIKTIPPVPQNTTQPHKPICRHPFCPPRQYKPQLTLPNGTIVDMRPSTRFQRLKDALLLHQQLPDKVIGVEIILHMRRGIALTVTEYLIVSGRPPHRHHDILKYDPYKLHNSTMVQVPHAPFSTHLHQGKRLMVFKYRVGDDKNELGVGCGDNGCWPTQEQKRQFLPLPPLPFYEPRPNAIKHSEDGKPEVNNPDAHALTGLAKREVTEFQDGEEADSQAAAPLVVSETAKTGKLVEREDDADNMPEGVAI